MVFLKSIRISWLFFSLLTIKCFITHSSSKCCGKVGTDIYKHSKLYNICIKKHLFLNSENTIKLLFIFDASWEWCLSVCWYIKSSTLCCLNVLRSGSLCFSTVPQIRSAFPAVWERAPAGRRRIRHGDDHGGIKQSDAFLKCRHPPTHTHTHTHTHTELILAFSLSGPGKMSSQVKLSSQERWDVKGGSTQA